MVGIRRGGPRVSALALLTVVVVIPALRAQARTPADHLKAGIAHLEAGDFLIGLMTLNEVVAPGSNADSAMVARAHAYRAQANLGLDQPERARAAALLALKADPSLIVRAPPFSQAVVVLFEGLRRAPIDEALINLNLYRLAAPDAYAAAINPNAGATGATTPARVAPPAVDAVAPKLASIYVYWPRGPRGNGKRKVLCDGFHVADLENRRYILLDVAPGTHDIQLNGKTLEVSAEAGRAYYLRTHVGGYPARLMFKEAPADQGLADLNDKDMSANVPRLTYSRQCTAGATAGRPKF